MLQQRSRDMPKDKAGQFAQPEKASRHKKPSNPEKDAKGQFAGSKADASNSGVSSADPRVISGKECGDATFPVKQDRSR